MFMMLQISRREHGSSGELDVFGATSYFAGLLAADDDDDDCRRPSSVITEPSSSAGHQLRMIQYNNKVQPTSHVPQQQQQQQLAGVVHDDAAERLHATQLQLVANKQPSPSPSPSPSPGKGKLAALLSFMVSPSPRASSFRKEKGAPSPSSSTTTRLQLQLQAEAAAAGRSFRKAASSRESSMRRPQGLLLGAHDDHDLDLGVATGDRRLQGIRVVRGSGGDEERWVVRCGGAWDDVDDDHRDKTMLVDASESSSAEKNKDHDELEEAGNDDGNDPDGHWDSDSSSDLFDLDLF